MITNNLKNETVFSIFRQLYNKLVSKTSLLIISHVKRQINGVNNRNSNGKLAAIRRNLLLRYTYICMYYIPNSEVNSGETRKVGRNVFQDRKVIVSSLLCCTWRVREILLFTSASHPHHR